MPSCKICLAFYVASGCYVCGLLAYLFHRQKISFFFLMVGFFFHKLFQIGRGWLIGIFTPNAIFNEVYFLPWCVASGGLGIKIFSNDKSSGSSSIVLLCLFSILALFFPKGIFPPSPKTWTIFSPLFFFFEVLAHACFVLGAWFAFLYLRQRENAKFFNSFIIWGFILYSIAQVVGATWCYLGWATPFHWGDRHLQSASLWCYYAAYLHLRFLSTWDIRKKAWFSLFGSFLVFIFSYGAHFSEMNIPRLGG